jgi:hypothetical protein
MASSMGALPVARLETRSSTGSPKPIVMRCNAHHYGARYTRDGRVERVIDPPPHSVVVPPRILNGKPFYAKRCPTCGFHLVRRPGEVYLEIETQWNKK